MLAMLLALGIPARAQAPPADNYRIFVLTMQPGDLVWEKFGHNAVWVHDESGELDLAYNWGLFDFDDANFFTNFARGLMLYSVGENDLDRSLLEYRVHNRTIWAQELNLTPDQKQQMVERLAINVLPENSHYLYNYYTDNCSTRVRDVIDEIVGGQIKSQLKEERTSRTWRWHTRRLTQGSPLWYTLLNTLLGPPGDVPLTAWDECFLPMHLRDNLAKVTLSDAVGNQRPLVSSERVLFRSTRPPAPKVPPSWIVRYGAIGCAIAAFNLLLLHWALRRRAGRIALGGYLVVYALAIGGIGMTALFFWTLTDHWAAYRNENMLAYSPLGLVLAIIVPAVFYSSGKMRKIVVVLALAIAGMTILGVIIQVLPGFDQVNGEPLALILAPNLALAWTLWFFNKHRPAVARHLTK